METQPTFSIVVPARDERAALPALYQRVKAVMDQVADEWELVLVDDGSRDQSPDVIAFLCAQDRRVRGISLTRNFGFQIALTAGMDAARGQAVILMDADLQIQPEVIPDLIGQWRAGFDVVYSVRGKCAEDSRLQRAMTGAFRHLIRRTAGGDFQVDAADGLRSDLRLLDRRVVEAMQRMPERHRVLRGMTAWAGFRQIGVNYPCPSRRTSGVEFPIGKMTRLALDAVTGFACLPLRLAGIFGFAAVLLSGLAVVLAIAFGASGMGQTWTSQMTTLAAVFFLGGVQLVCTGIIGEYLGRIYDETKQRPLYLVDQCWGFTEQTKR